MRDTPMADWTLTIEQPPPEGVEVEVMNGPIVQTLVLERGLWWFPDRSMYVYFTPRVWRPLGNDGKRCPECGLDWPAHAFECPARNEGTNDAG
jgi:hypothetical protein